MVALLRRLYVWGVPNHYAVLKVTPSADRAEIRASFRALARRYHPDVGGDAERMQAIIEAWAVLGRPERRATYDLELAVARRQKRGRAQEAGPSGQGAGTATAERAG